MSGSSPRQPGAKAGGQADVERALLLRDVMDHAVKVHKETTKPFAVKRSRARPILLGSTMTLLLAFAAYSWIARPAFIWGPTAAPLPAAEQEAGLRFAMFLLSQRVEGYRVTQGTLPTSLVSVGESLPGVTYSVVSEGVFELRATSNGKQLVFRSDQPADDFLGNSPNIIQGFAPK